MCYEVYIWTFNDCLNLNVLFIYQYITDHLLHEQALEEGIIDHLVVILKTQKVASQQTEQSESSLLIKHSVVCLLLLLHSSPEQRKKLGGDYELLMSLVKSKEFVDVHVIAFTTFYDMHDCMM